MKRRLHFRFGSVGLLGRILLILVAVMATELITNTYLFDRASQFALQEDEVQRMAEQLVVAHRLFDRATPEERQELAREIKTERFSVRWQLKEPATPSSFELATLRDQLLKAEPELARTSIALHLRSFPKRGGIDGSMMLSDGSRLGFHSNQWHGIWSLTYGRLIALMAPTLVLVFLGGLLIRHTLRPLSVLIRETGRVGTDEHQPVPEAGPGEVRKLIHAFNAMQLRIHRLISGRTQALAAVGHDLRTPLARLRLRLDSVEMDDRTRVAMERDVEEMTGLLHSLQSYLSSDGRTMPAERIDLAAMAMTLIDTARDEGEDALYSGPETLEIIVRPVAIRRALSNLIDNALHYGGNVRLHLDKVSGATGDVAEIIVEDDGPGIAVDQLDEVLQPFVRLDDARTRNTRGMGLGLAIVSDAVRMEEGDLTLSNHRGGGLRAKISLPLREKQLKPTGRS